MDDRLTDRARKVLKLANQEAQRLNHEYIGTEHILLGLVKEGSGVGANVLKNLDIDLRKIRLEVEKAVARGPDKPAISKLPQTPRAKKVIEYAVEESHNLNHNYLGTEHLLLGLLREQEGVAAQVLLDLGLKLEVVREEVLNFLRRNMAKEEGGERQADKGKSKTPALDSFGRDLTELARLGKLDPLIGRVEELNRLVRTLCRRSRSCPVLLGEAGVGKTAIVEGLAQLIVEEQVPDDLAGCRVVAIDLAMMVSGTKYRGQFEERVKAMSNEVRRAGNVILFLDDLHLWAYNESVLSSLALNRGDLRRCISATTPVEFTRVQEKACTLARYFTPVAIPALSAAAGIEVLRGLRDRYEAHHRVLIKDEALQAAIELTAPDGGSALVDKAIDLIDEAAAEVHLFGPSGYYSRPPEVRELDGQIEQFNMEKERAVAEQDFDKAAHLRDQADKLKKKKEDLVREWRRKSAEDSAEVDAEVVRQVARKM